MNDVFINLYTFDHQSSFSCHCVGISGNDASVSSSIVLINPIDDQFVLLLHDFVAVSTDDAVVEEPGNIGFHSMVDYLQINIANTDSNSELQLRFEIETVLDS